MVKICFILEPLGRKPALSIFVWVFCGEVFRAPKLKCICDPFKEDEVLQIPDEEAPYQISIKNENQLDKKLESDFHMFARSDEIISFRSSW